jgi:hypothetical protein
MILFVTLSIYIEFYKDISRKPVYQERFELHSGGSTKSMSNIIFLCPSYLVYVESLQRADPPLKMSFL